MSVGKNGVWEVKKPSLNNIYPGTQYNRSYMKITYNVETDIFKEYGYTTATKLEPENVPTDTKFMAYSYLINSTVSYDLGQEYTVFMYMYISEDCNAPFRLNLEHNNTWVSNSEGTTGNITIAEKGVVKKVWGRCKASEADGKIYIMFYPNTNNINEFTTGYQLVTGITILKGDEVIPATGGFIEEKKENTKIYKHYMTSSDFIEM